jgi:endonuclease YncB( thermonuclease family)
MTYKYNSVCIKVIDGDTIDAFVDLGFEIWIKKRIRLYGIDLSLIHI